MPLKRKMLLGEEENENTLVKRKDVTQEDRIL